MPKWYIQKTVAVSFANLLHGAQQRYVIVSICYLLRHSNDVSQDRKQIVKAIKPGATDRQEVANRALLARQIENANLGSKVCEGSSVFMVAVTATSDGGGECNFN